MPNSKQIVYLSQNQYAELIANGSITVDGVTVEYNENDLYVTPQAEPITDVRANGVSITSNGIANIPKASNSSLGLVKGTTAYGTNVNNEGQLVIYAAIASDYKNGIEGWRPVTPGGQHKSVYYGLSKLAGIDLKNETITEGIYPDASKAAIQNMLGITDLISTEETTTATAAHAINSTFMMNGKLHRATAAIAIGDAVEVGTNCEVVKADEVFVKKTDYATALTGGIIRVGNGLQMAADGERLYIRPSDSVTIKAGTEGYKPIAPYWQHEAVFYGLSKVAGVDLASETVTLGTYPETSKTAIRSLIGAAAASDIPSVPVQDVQVAGTSALSNGIANIPIANSSTPGVIKIGDGLRINTSNQITINSAGSTLVKQGTASSVPLTPEHAYEAAFYGLAKAAGADEKDSTLSVGTYTETAKSAIREMLGAASPDVIAVQDEQPTNADTKVWLPETQATGVEVPTYAEFTAGLAGKVSDVQVNGTSVVSSGVANVPIAGNGINGVVQVSGNQGLGISQTTPGLLVIGAASSTVIKTSQHAYAPIVPSHQHEATFYGLAKAAGDTTQSASSNVVGTYTDSAKASIKSMLGIVDGSTGTVDITGTTPSITAVENTRYVCGEVSTLSFTPAASGICIVRFTSGSTATVLTVPNTVKFPEWFDITALEADTIYEMCITDGIYGAVMSWAL